MTEKPKTTESDIEDLKTLICEYEFIIGIIILNNMDQESILTMLKRKMELYINRVSDESKTKNN